ncbi:MAG: DUF4899 domain-containing protein [Spirochaetota bacterium]|nr:MAG: DUF4899 domain-containing protein [Spirochaetota bacterium]
MADSEDFLAAENGNHMILKGRLKAVETNTYGLFIIFFNDSTGTMDSLMAIASHYSSLYDIDPHLPWYMIEENITDLRWKGDIAVNISIDLQNYMESGLERDRGSELYGCVKNNDETRIDSLLQALLIKPLGDRNIELETVSEFITKASMENIRKERDKSKAKDAQQKPSPTTEKEPSTVNVDLVLAPVSGIPIYELQVGDKIMVKLVDMSTKGRYYIDLLGARVNGNIIPVPAEVTDIKKSEDSEYTIICKIGEDAYGKAVETELVKLKRYDELFQSTTDTELPSIDEITEKRKFPLFVVVVGGLMFVVVFIFLIMWFYNIL